MYKRMLLFTAVVALVAASQENESLAPEIFKQQLGATANSVLLDVRTTPEVKEGFIEGAIQMDINDRKFKSNLATLDKEKTYFVYCASGIRSARALAMMKDMGFSHVYHLAGGIVAWKEAGLPVVKK